ncbi:Dihydroorotate oxidase [Chthoniobacter flavus Ellin428]|uniref:Dihydroorotate dehydrogenase (quinone) n=1 Tax=Chthoniobacter flavus Ellin428 TaxID=497964 RepID=B4D718_9BACT|nr:quinone-dependent dihydroorotate dehydrogenase [Chthoniobacter flavus]EDY17669.1 Dihydroorotate oxidase [Chthoniobacter flavus Ellin428]TCO84085.1 dihydroorotate oxidase A [Chthoniobacter flavus]
MNLYKEVIRPFLFLGDPEKVHHLAMDALALTGPLLRRFAPKPDPRLERTVFGLRFPNPVGLAAGFDKNGVALPAWEGLGFGFAEIGTITARSQPGNPKPRIFRIPQSRALINRLGFNNDGCDLVASRLQRLKESGHWPTVPVGINLGKSKVTPLAEATADYLLSFERLQHFGDYFVLNVSSPNTPGLRNLQDRAALDELLGHVQRRNTSGRPVLVKIAPDLQWEAIEEILALVEEHKIAGIIATNTTIDHTSIPEAQRTQGGLSGAPLQARSTEIIRFITKHSKVPVIAVGGIMNADAALEKFDAGAALVQLYTGYIYEGPGLIGKICQALLQRG